MIIPKNFAIEMARKKSERRLHVGRHAGDMIEAQQRGGMPFRPIRAPMVPVIRIIWHRCRAHLEQDAACRFCAYEEKEAIIGCNLASGVLQSSGQFGSA